MFGFPFSEVPLPCQDSFSLKLPFVLFQIPKTLTQSPHWLFGFAGIFLCCYFQPHHCSNPLQSLSCWLSGNVRHSQGSKCRALWTQHSFSACIISSQQMCLCRTLTAPGGFLMTLQSLSGLFQSSRMVYLNLAVSLISSTFPSISGAVTVAMCLLNNLVTFWVPSSA